MRFWGSTVGVLGMWLIALLPGDVTVHPRLPVHPAAVTPYEHPVSGLEVSPGSFFKKGLVAAYEFNDPNNLGHDSGPYGYHLTPVNTPTATGGAPAYAADFELGSTQHANGGDVLDSVAGVSFAVAGWTRNESLPATSIWISKAHNLASQGQWYAALLGGAFNSYCAFHDGVGVKSDADVSGTAVGERALFACRFNATSNALEAGKNGAFSGTPTTTAAGSIDTSSDLLVSGFTAAPSSLFDGVVAPIAFYQSVGGDALSAANFASLYNSGKGKTCGELTAAERVNLVSCWDMDEDGGPYVDSIGSNNLTGVNTPTQVAALVEQPSSGMSTWLVAASSQYLNRAQTPAPAGKAVSFCAWINPVTIAAGNRYIVGSYPTTNTGGFYGYQQTASFTFVARKNGDAAVPSIAAGTMDANSWNHVCAIWNTSTVTSYLNTAPDATPGVSTGLWTENDVALAVGSTSAGMANFDGAIDSVLIFDKDIGQTGVTKLYNAGVGVFYAFDWTWEQPFTRFAFSMPEIVKTPRSPEEIKHARRIYVH